MKFAADRPFADPDQAARKLLELANAAEADKDQRIAIELINLPFLCAGGSADEYRAGIERGVAKGLLGRHEWTRGGNDMWKGIAIGVGLAVESALCANAQTPDQSEETKRTLTQQFLDCVTSQVITIDDLTSDVAGIARGAVSLCRAEAHAAAVSKAGSQNELVPNLRTGLEASGIETGIAALLKSRAACISSRPLARRLCGSRGRERGRSKSRPGRAPHRAVGPVRRV